MFVGIGEKTDNDFSNPMGMLTDCHRKLERILQGFLTVTAEARGTALTPEQRTVIEMGLRYFEKFAPQHARDEEESLFPRMRSTKHPDVQAILTVLDALDADHVEAAAVHAEMDTLGRKWLAEGSLSPDEAGRLEKIVRELNSFYQRHIGIEDRDVFPLAGRVLTATEMEAVGKEMAARRGIEYPG
ncbi:MAG: hemerythrin domain-containing protein [Acidobacteria bacterium]|nr:hemerythrin domain-containing protein [Acidobacteriota bacterium]